MKNLLKIDDKKAMFLKRGEEYALITDISREDILNLLHLTLENEVTFDDPKNKEIVNEAQKLIYSDLYEQFIEFENSKEDILKDVNSVFKEKLEKYDEIK